jgi:PIN domain nuclease of toxin-antitoxin system
MNRYLLDTHAVLWWLDRPERLTPQAREAIGNPRNLVCFSAVSMFEIATKEATGKLRVGDDFLARLAECRFEALPMTQAHAEHVRHLPMHHKDPFDRMLVAQARAERLTLLTRDPLINGYDVPVLAV